MFDVEKLPLPPCRPTGLLTMIQRATDASLVESLGVQPIPVQGIGRNPKQWEGRVYFDLEDPEQPTVRLRAWISGKRAPQWNQVLFLTVLIRTKIKKPGVMIEPELEVVGIQESGQVASSRDELRKKFIAAINAKKLVVADIFLKEMPKVILVTNQGGEADRDIQSQLVGYRDLLAWEIQSVRMTEPQSVSTTLKDVLGKVGQVDLVVLARGGGEGIAALDHEQVLQAASARAVPLVTAIGHANDHTILDDIADFSLAVPSMVGKWLAEQLEMKARRQADSKRLSGLKLEEELKKLQGEMVAVGKARVEEQKALLQLQTDWGALVERVNNLSQNRSLWRTGALVAWVFIGGWIAGKILGWW